MHELPDQYEPTPGWQLLGLALCACSAALVIGALAALWRWAAA